MKRKFLSVIVGCILCLSCFTAFADGAEKVEIQFAVGDSVLSINGQNIEVETPYIVGEGTTLVPLRVITEAFGAQVDWDGTTQKITLTYPDVNIVLHINSKVAQVNDHNETLPEPPALSANGITMVPLRFISETFGATVGFDGATSRVTVTKEAIHNDTVQGKTELAKTGDSYFKWSIDTPKNMSIDYRTSNGDSVFYMDGYENRFSITANYSNPKKGDIQEALSDLKDLVAGTTLMKAETGKDSQGNEFAHVKCKSKEKNVEVKRIYTKKFDYIVSTVVSLDTPKEDVAKIDELFHSFSTWDGSGEDVYNLSTVDPDGYYLYENNKFKLSVRVPAYLCLNENSQEENVLEFKSKSYEHQNSRCNIAIFSKTENCTAKILADLDKTSNCGRLNPNLTTFEQLQNYTISGISGLRYGYTVKNSVNDDKSFADVFFELGNYVYNIAVETSEKDTAIIEQILPTFKVEKLSRDEIGDMMRNDPDFSRPLRVDLKSVSFELPGSWQEETNQDISDKSGRYSAFDRNTASLIMFEIYANETAVPAATVMNYVKDSMLKDSAFKNTLIDKVEGVTLNGVTFQKMQLKSVSKDGEILYAAIYIGVSKGKVIQITLLEPELFYSGKTGLKVSEVLTNMTIK
ncbi:MAG TPA: hypothetical protein DD391_01910 [Clostridiales bacterium]|nr:hypothetical protein [Clostridiales bacterium]